MDIIVRPIGVIRSPNGKPAGTPIQPVYADEIEGEVVVEEAYEPALVDIEAFERIWLVYWFDRAGAFKLRVVPYRDTVEHGLFATRAPNRPNAIGLSMVRLLRRDRNVLHIAGVDILDGTPLLDIKPYVPGFDAYPVSKAGWLDSNGADREAADQRFHRE